MMKNNQDKEKKYWDIIIAGALLKNLHKRGEIKDSTWKAIEKDIKKRLCESR